MNLNIFYVQTYLPRDTPVPLRKYRDEELLILRGEGKRELREWDRIYENDVYNDLRNPDEGMTMLVLLLEDLVSILTLVGEEQADYQQEQVRQYMSKISSMFYFFIPSSGSDRGSKSTC